MKELKVIFGMIPNAVVSTSSYFDLYYLASDKPEIPSTKVETFADTSDVESKLEFLTCKLEIYALFWKYV